METAGYLGLFLLAMSLCSTGHALIENLYCGKDNCYEVLDIGYDATKEDKESASLMFQKVANAYEILRDEEQRTDYNYYLDHPEEYYAHYYRYYRRRMAPKVDVRIVIVVTISVISVIQYWSAWNNYNTALCYLITVPKYRMKAIEIAKQEGVYDVKKKKDRTKTKVELKLMEWEFSWRATKNLSKVYDQNLVRGGYRKPKIYDILWLKLLLLPYDIVMYLLWWIKWIWKFWIKKEEYGLEEREYLIRRNMKMSQDQWEEWKRLKEEEMKAELATNARYKSYRRYMKKGGPGQMMFGPE
ncbi:hypothetical protein LSH36_1259g00012 [Paralvinella palmiformis]|uniref:J domain-containing protein n=1 Tax=Paralvinella palmiformis TaxID=53620 RepID=A0AAD9IUD1_9ANNE|nr:hypothetical protein LSH36_1259g00012 [Paralvinella palmiformis]